MSWHPLLRDRLLLAGLLLALPLAWLIGRLSGWLVGLGGLVALEAGLALAMRTRRRAASGEGPPVPVPAAGPRAPSWSIVPWADARRSAAVAGLEAELEATTAQLVAAQLQLLSLYDVLRGITAAGGRAQIVDALLLHCRQRCDAREAHCYLVEGTTTLRRRRLVLREGTTAFDEALLPRPDRGGLAVVLAQGAPLLIADPALHPLLPGGEPPPAGLAYLAVPLPAAAGDGPATGAVVVFGSPGAGRLDEGARIWLAALGRAAGAVLENATLYARLNAEHALRDGILNSLGAGLIAFGADGAPLFHNRAAREMLDLTETEMSGLTPTLLCPELAWSETSLAPAASGARAQAGVETALHRPGRSALAVRLTVARLPGREAGEHGLLCVFDDLTSLRAMQDQIRQLDKLAAIGRFTSSLAHEIRNPLAGISAGIDYLRRTGGLGEEHQQYVQIISQEIGRLDRIIRHLFTVARPGYLMIRRRTLEQVLCRVVAGLEPAAAQKRIDFHTEMCGPWREIECDEDQIQQVLLNLLKNAVEAEEAGGTVRITVGGGERDGEAPGGEAAGEGLVLTVENGGSALSAADLERVFEPFYSRKPEGTGLGLFVSYNIVKQHGGALAAVSAPGGRTRFRLFLPCTQPRATEVA